jgi:hypothetical protein
LQPVLVVAGARPCFTGWARTRRAITRVVILAGPVLSGQYAGAGDRVFASALGGILIEGIREPVPRPVIEAIARATIPTSGSFARIGTGATSRVVAGAAAGSAAGAVA